jgi:hypothetical protein
MERQKARSNDVFSRAYRSATNSTRQAGKRVGNAVGKTLMNLGNWNAKRSGPKFTRARK